MSSLLALFLFGMVFALMNAVQSRLINNGTKRRFPDWLVALSVCAVATVYTIATRYVASSVGPAAALCYGVGSALGVIAGTRLANGPLFDRFHPSRHDRGGTPNEDVHDA